MGRNTTIEWTHWPGQVGSSWNPWVGCKKKSPGCEKCYMYRERLFYGQNPEIVVRSKTTFNDPLKWKEPHVIFSCSWSDWFNPEADGWRWEAWSIVKRCPQHIFLILTKLHNRIERNLPGDWGAGWPNVMLMVSAENQQYADIRLKYLLRIPARWHGVSAEPLLGPIDFQPVVFAARYELDWIVTGGESDKLDPRPCDLDWIRDIHNQCQQAGWRHFHKQHGGRTKIDGVWGGRTIDGQTYSEFPVA